MGFSSAPRTRHFSSCSANAPAQQHATAPQDTPRARASARQCSGPPRRTDVGCMRPLGRPAPTLRTQGADGPGDRRLPSGRRRQPWRLAAAHGGRGTTIAPRQLRQRAKVQGPVESGRRMSVTPRLGRPRPGGHNAAWCVLRRAPIAALRFLRGQRAASRWRELASS